MNYLLSILGFGIMFIIPVVNLILVIAVFRHTRQTAIRQDGIQSRIDALIKASQIDLGNLSIPDSLGSSIKPKLAMRLDRVDALSLIESHLGVNSEQAQTILDRYMSEHHAEELFPKDNDKIQV